MFLLLFAQFIKVKFWFLILPAILPMRKQARFQMVSLYFPTKLYIAISYSLNSC